MAISQLLSSESVVATPLVLCMDARTEVTVVLHVISGSCSTTAMLDDCLFHIRTSSLQVQAVSICNHVWFNQFLVDFPELAQ